MFVKDYQMQTWLMFNAEQNKNEQFCYFLTTVEGLWSVEVYMLR